MNSKKAKQIKRWCLVVQRDKPELFLKDGALKCFYKHIKSEYKARADVREMFNENN